MTRKFVVSLLAAAKLKCRLFLEHEFTLKTGLQSQIKWKYSAEATSTEMTFKDRNA